MCLRAQWGLDATLNTACESARELLDQALLRSISLTLVSSMQYLFRIAKLSMTRRSNISQYEILNFALRN